MVHGSCAEMKTEHWGMVALQCMHSQAVIYTHRLWQQGVIYSTKLCFCVWSFLSIQYRIFDIQEKNRKADKNMLDVHGNCLANKIFFLTMKVTNCQEGGGKGLVNVRYIS